MMSFVIRIIITINITNIRRCSGHVGFWFSKGLEDVRLDEFWALGKFFYRLILLLTISDESSWVPCCRCADFNLGTPDTTSNASKAQASQGVYAGLTSDMTLRRGHPCFEPKAKRLAGPHCDTQLRFPDILETFLFCIPKLLLL